MAIPTSGTYNLNIVRLSIDWHTSNDLHHYAVNGYADGKSNLLTTDAAVTFRGKSFRFRDSSGIDQYVVYDLEFGQGNYRYDSVIVGDSSSGSVWTYWVISAEDASATKYPDTFLHTGRGNPVQRNSDFTFGTRTYSVNLSTAGFDPSRITGPGPRPDTSRPGKVSDPSSNWTIAESKKIVFDDPTTTVPPIDYNFPVPFENMWQWDTWPLRDAVGNTTTYNGWYVIFSLLAPRRPNEDINESWNARHGRAYIGYFYSRTGNGSDWIYGGRLLASATSNEQPEWAGCAVLRDDKNTVDLFYTKINANEQIVAHASGTINTTSTELWFEGFTSVETLFGGDGKIYASRAQNPYYNFRDPFLFYNKPDNSYYLLFEANLAGTPGSLSITGTERGDLAPGTPVASDSNRYTGAVGIAKIISDTSKGEWNKCQLLRPLISSLGVHDQIERPHIVLKDDAIYIFVIAHGSYFSKNATGPDGIYGFVSHNGLFGVYDPLNESGLVLGNPSTAPVATYSHLVDSEGYVTSFIDLLPAPGDDPVNPKTWRLGGTLAPTLRLDITGNTTALSGTPYNYGQFFAARQYECDDNIEKCGFVEAQAAMPDQESSNPIDENAGFVEVQAAMPDQESSNPIDENAGFVEVQAAMPDQESSNPIDENAGFVET